MAGGAGGNYVGEQATIITFADGAFSAALVPNDAITPAGTYYRVSWCISTPGSPTSSWTENWIVPTSGSPVTVASVVVTSPPSPSYQIQAAQLAPGGTSGQVLTRDGSAQGQSWQTPAGGGGAIKQASVRVSNAQLAALGGAPVTIVPAQGARSVIYMIGYMVHYQDDASLPLDWGGMAFGIVASGGQFSSRLILPRLDSRRSRQAV